MGPRREEDRPRITVITNGNYFSNLGLGPLLGKRHTDWQFQIVVTNGLRKPKVSRRSEAIRLFRRWGWRYSLYKIAVLILPAAFAKFGKPGFNVEQTCHRLTIPCIHSRNANGRHIRDTISEFGPDILLSFSCPYKIGTTLLEIPRIGCINVHSSLLPAYAGVCTYVHVLADNCGETGITVHEMVERFDAGRILAQKSVTIAPNSSVFSLFTNLCRQAPSLLDDVITDAMASGSINGFRQNLDRRSYCGEPSSQDIARLRKAGHTLIHGSDWPAFLAYAKESTVTFH